MLGCWDVGMLSPFVVRRESTHVVLLDFLKLKNFEKRDLPWPLQNLYLKMPNSPDGLFSSAVHGKSALLLKINQSTQLSLSISHLGLLTRRGRNY